jgi:UDP-glucuronate decarboxylase
MNNEIILRDAQSICERANLAELMDASILVTGSSGLIGTHFLACLYHLKQHRNKPTVYAQMLSDPPPHLAELILKGGFKVLRINLAESNEYTCLPEVDVIIHSAGYAQPSLFMADPISTIQLNTVATAALMRRVKTNGRFLFLSSSEVYSGIDKAYANEDDIGRTTPYHPRAAYIEGKRCGEAICNAYRSQGLRVTSARLAHTYGPGTRKHDRRALNLFIERGLNGGKIELRDAGTAVRTYCYVADAVELLWQILLRGKEPVYNVGGHSTVTIAELARMVGQLTGTEVSIPATGMDRTGGPEEVRLDLTRVETEFGKNQYVSLETGLGATVEWQRKWHLNQP